MCKESYGIIESILGLALTTMGLKPGTMDIVGFVFESLAMIKHEWFMQFSNECWSFEIEHVGIYIYIHIVYTYK